MQLPTPCNLLIIDTETTGLSPEEGKVIELAAVLYSVDHQTTLQQVSFLSFADSNPAEHINHIPASVLSTITPETVLPAWRMFCAMASVTNFVVAHNAEFDRQWFREGVAATALINPQTKEPLPWLCTMTDFTWPKQTKPGESLVNLALHHGVGVGSAHRALTDCQLIANILDRLTPEELHNLLVNALVPRYWYKADVSYANKDLAKEAGFRWSGTDRVWFQKLTEAQAQEFSFPVVRLSTKPT